MTNVTNTNMVLLERIPEGRRVGVVDAPLRDFADPSSENRSISVLFDGFLLARPDVAQAPYDKISRGVLEHPHNPSIDGCGLGLAKDQSGFRCR